MQRYRRATADLSRACKEDITTSRSNLEFISFRDVLQIYQQQRIFPLKQWSPAWSISMNSKCEMTIVFLVQGILFMTFFLLCWVCLLFAAVLLAGCRRKQKTGDKAEFSVAGPSKNPILVSSKFFFLCSYLLCYSIISTVVRNHTFESEDGRSGLHVGLHEWAVSHTARLTWWSTLSC